MLDRRSKNTQNCIILPFHPFWKTAFVIILLQGFAEAQHHVSWSSEAELAVFLQAIVLSRKIQS